MCRIRKQARGNGGDSAAQTGPVRSLCLRLCDCAFVHAKIGPEDLPRFRRCGFTDWQGETLSNERLLRHGHWTVSRDGKWTLYARGGGAFEIPEMFSFRGPGVSAEITSPSGTGYRTETRDGEEVHVRTISVSMLAVPGSRSERLRSLLAEAFFAQDHFCAGDETVRYDVVFR